MTVLSQLFRAVWWFYSRLWAPLMALGWPALVVYGATFPRPADVAAIHQHGGGTPLLIGFTTGGSVCRNSEPCVVSPAQRSYLAFPSAISSAAVTTVEDATDGVTVHMERGAALGVIPIWLICVYGTWYYWFRPRGMASNNKLQRTRGGSFGEQ